MINVALIGIGGHSRHCHAPALRRYADERPGQVALTAVCDLDAERVDKAAEEFGFARAFTDIDAMFAGTPGGIDAVVAIMPIAVTPWVTRQLLPRGIPLLIEKPLGANISEARALAAAVDEAGAADRVMVSLNRRFDPGLTRGLAWARAQGPLRCVRGTMLRSARSEPDFVWGTGIHLIDALQYVAGPLVLRELDCPGRPDAPDCWRTASFEGAHGEIVRLEIIPTSGHPWKEHLRLFGDEYCVEVQTGAAPPWIVQGYRNGRLELDDAHAPDEPGYVSNGTFAETSAFLDAVAAGRPLPSPGIHVALASSELAARLQAL